MIEQTIDCATGIVPQPDELRAKALQYAGAARIRLDEARESVEVYTTRQPVRALGIAFGLGAFMGWMIKRR